MTVNYFWQSHCAGGIPDTVLKTWLGGAQVLMPNKVAKGQQQL